MLHVVILRKGRKRRRDQPKGARRQGDCHFWPVLVNVVVSEEHETRHGQTHKAAAAADRPRMPKEPHRHPSRLSDSPPDLFYPLPSRPHVSTKESIDTLPLPCPLSVHNVV
ncbi:hypothetical protein AcW2_006671 [Taiwanofungus camphoratus]|nr:hypothetical protein AcW2_006671 [Antrodia cinnamomea]